VSHADGSPGTDTGTVGVLRRWLAVESVCIRRDVRRPAAWLAAAACCAVGVVVAAAPLAGVLPVVIACGGLGAVAALGAVEPDAWGGGVWSGAGRVRWPVAGAIAAGIACGSPVPVALGVAAAFAAGPAWCAARLGLPPADVSAVALATAFIAAAALAFVPVDHRLAACVGVGLVGMAAAAWMSASWTGGLPLALDVVVERARAATGRSPLDWPAMVSALAAMAICFFLVPEYAWCYTLVAVGWFVCLAVPAATIAAGARDGAVRAALVHSAPGHPPLPGTATFAGRVVATQVAILGWPAAVAAALWGQAAARTDGPLLALGLLAAAAVITMAAGVVATRGERGETMLALVAVVAMAGIVFFLPPPSLGRGRSEAGGERVSEVRISEREAIPFQAAALHETAGEGDLRVGAEQERRGDPHHPFRGR
jgi:hypothetical protein